MLVAWPTYLVFQRALEPGLGAAIDSLREPEVVHALYLTLYITFFAVLINLVFGLTASILLVRYDFPGKRILSTLLDVPLAISPVVVGLALVLVYNGRDGWFGPSLEKAGFQVIFASPGMIMATVFVALPLVIREVVPVLEEIGLDEEDASRTLGASVWHTFFKVTLPNIRWALAYGIALTTARAIGEIGAVLIVSGLIQGKTETATLFIYRAYEERQTAEAYVVALVLAAVSVGLLIVIEVLRHRQEKERTRT
jgi:sulfate transport system permease protein